MIVCVGVCHKGFGSAYKLERTENFPHGELQYMFPIRISMIHFIAKIIKKTGSSSLTVPIHIRNKAAKHP